MNPEKKEEINEEEEEIRIRTSTGLIRSGRIFGGLINDIKRKAPWYIVCCTFHFTFIRQLIEIVVFSGTGRIIGMRCPCNVSLLLLSFILLVSLR